MGPEIALLLAAGGTAASMLGQRQQAKERRSILNRSMERTNKTQDAATALIQGEARKYTPQDRMQDMQAQEQATYGQQQRDLGGAGGALIDTAGDKGNVSADFLKASADKALSEGNRLTAVAREIARARAPGQQLQTEGVRRAGVIGDVGSRWGTARNLAEASQHQAAGVEEPWWGQLGKVAQMAGMAGMGGAGLGGAGTAGVTGANGAFLGEGIASGISGWDAAMGAVPMGSGAGLSSNVAKRLARIRFGG